MRLTVRQEQIEALDAVSKAKFEHRIKETLRADYSESVVKLPDGTEAPTGELPEETLDRFVVTGIKRARSHGMTHEASIAAFVLLMFSVSPNFDKHRLCQLLLEDEEHEPDERIDGVLETMTEKNWDLVRNDYDPQAWEEKEEKEEAAAAEPVPEPVKPGAPSAADLDKTMMVSPKGVVPEVPAKPPQDLAATMIDIPKMKAPEKAEKPAPPASKDVPSVPDFGFLTNVIKKKE